MFEKPNDGIMPNDAEKIEAFLASKASKIFAVRKLLRWFEIDLTIKILGVQVFHWHYPPLENDPNEQVVAK